MIITSDIQALRDQISTWKKAGERIAFIPTMGNLHDGHLSLLERGKALADRTVVSIFVNPLQFGANEDLDKYPRTAEEDSEKLQNKNNDLLFKPNVEDIIQAELAIQTTVSVPHLSNILCGQSRPGHFDGVATIVAKLFNLVQPDIAVFGKKDYQQVRIIQKMVDDLNFPIQIITAPTSRTQDGLALSSRNQYLTPEQRKIAPQLRQTLVAMREEFKKKSSNYSDLEKKYKIKLENDGFKVDYLSIRTKERLQEPSGGTSEPLIILAAAFLGNTRLIDNICLHMNEP